MDCQGVNAKVKQFDDAHGNFIVVVADGCIYFEDGAYRDANPMGVLMPPPTDPRKLARSIVRYWKLKLALAVNEFDHYKRQHLSHAQNTRNENVASAPLAAQKEVAKHLRSLQKKVKMYAGKLAEAEAKYETYKPQRQLALEEMDKQHRNAAESLIDELKNIEI